MCVLIDVLALDVSVEDLVDMLLIKEVLGAFLSKLFRGINKQNATIWIVFLEDDDACRNASREEDTCW